MNIGPNAILKHHSKSVQIMRLCWDSPGDAILYRHIVFKKFTVIFYRNIAPNN